MAKRLNVWEDDIKKILKLNVGDEFTLMKQFNFSGENGYSAKQHLKRNLPIGKKYFVSENISKYHLVIDSVVNYNIAQFGYSADSSEYSLIGYEEECVVFRSSKMPEMFSRFKVEAVEYVDIFNDSTTWFSASVKFKILEKIECR